MTPIGGGGLTPLGGAATLTPLSSPLTPLGGADALSALTPLDATAGLEPYDPLGQPKSAATPVKKPKKQQSYALIWILLTGILFVILPFGVLSIWWIYGNAANTFQLAEAEYTKGALSSAMEKYDKYIQDNPSGKEVGRAKVKRNMAEIRQIAGEGKNARQGLDKLKAKLPEMEQEEAFTEVRSELRTLLVEIARGFAAQAVATKETAKREELVGLAEETMKMINNPAYIGAKDKAEILPQLTDISDRLKAAKRSID